MCGEFKAFVEIQNVYLSYTKKKGGIVYGIKIFNKQYSNLELYKKTKKWIFDLKFIYAC